MSAVIQDFSISDALGRSDIDTNFYAGEYERLSAIKMAERQRVSDFILSHFDDINWVYLLTLPGQHWIFEQMMLRTHSRMQCVGLERSSTVFHRSLSGMPKSSVSLAVKTKPVGMSSYEYARTPAHPKHPNITAQSHRLLRVTSDAYVAMLGKEVTASNNQIRKFRNKFGQRNAAWLDFTSGFCRSVDETIAGLNACIREGYKQMPVVMTLMYGRDIPGKELGRINHIHRLNPNFEPVDFWTYSGFNGCPMISISGLLHRANNSARGAA